jgi:ornithine cyclodeaminase/alanine dehydrogenase-like protein (mu-crystallin family)
MLLIDQASVRRLLPMAACIEAMEGVFRRIAENRVLMPLRTVIMLPEGRGAFAAMPAVLQDPPGMGIKVISVYPANHGTQYDSHQGAVLLFESEHGSPVALMDASSITAIRTAAASAVATRLLAREKAHTLALLGTGVQAATHLEAMQCVRPIERVRVWSRSREHAAAFAEREGGRRNLRITVADSAHDAVRGADIVCTVTSSRTPVLRGDWLEPGMHINAVGASTRATRELDGAAMSRCRIYADRRESLVNEAGDFLMAREEGFVKDESVVGEIGDLVAQRVPGREKDSDITLFKSLGLAAEDVASAQLIYETAQLDSTVPRFTLGGLRDPE